MNIYEKLTTIQNELKAPKNQYNSFGKYNYRSCEDILTAVKPLAKKHKVSVYLSDELEHIGERYYIRATAHFVDFEADNSEIVVNAYAREDESKKGMDGSQVTGTASSYSRKYALNALFDIDDTKDADTDEYKKITQKTAENNNNNLICPVCGKPVLPIEINGKTYQAASVMKKYNSCFECHKKSISEKENAK